MTPIEIGSLRPLVVPVPLPSAAPETAPEESVPYPTMGEVCSALWCEEEDGDDDDDDGDGTDRVCNVVRISMIC